MHDHVNYEPTVGREVFVDMVKVSQWAQQGAYMYKKNKCISDMWDDMGSSWIGEYDDKLKIGFTGTNLY